MTVLAWRSKARAAGSIAGVHLPAGFIRSELEHRQTADDEKFVMLEPAAGSLGVTLSTAQ